MPTDIKANELRDVDVSFVSLVKRGANRIPFRLTKKDGNMIDFNRIFFRKADEAEAAKAVVIVKDAAAEAAVSAVVPGTMPIPATPEAAVEAATAILKQNGYSVMMAQAEQVAAQPDAKASNAADKGAGAEKPADKPADKKEAVAEKPAADKEKAVADKKAAVAAKKAELEAEEAELVELEKGAAQKSKPQDTKVNESENKEDTSAKGVIMPKALAGDGSEEIAEHPEIDKDGSEEKKKTFALMAKLEETVTKAVADLAALVKSSTEATEKRLAGVEASVKKSDATIVAKVLGGAPGDEQPANVRKAASSAPPLLDTGLTGANRFS